MFFTACFIENNSRSVCGLFFGLNDIKPVLMYVESYIGIEMSVTLLKEYKNSCRTNDKWFII